MLLIYTLIYYLAIPLILLRQLWRARRDRRHIARLGERFGYISPITGQQQRLWIHTVSVGEFLGALPLIRQLLARADCELIVTSTTLTGSERIRQTLGDRVHHFYMPYDLPGAVRRFIKTADPDLLVIMETELWPNTIAVCHGLGVPSVLINARLSQRSADGYARLPRLTGAMLSRLGAAGIQSTADAQRFERLGLAADKIHVTGNIKFDIELDHDLRQHAQQLRDEWSATGKRLIWIAASTHSGEDEIMLDALAQLHRRGIGAERLLLVLVPRHPERFDSVADTAKARGFTIERRSTGRAPGAHVDLVIGDTMGEMTLLFGASDIVFMGGSLVDVGGHNFIEPAVWARPLLSGPVLYNFAEVSRLMREAGALEIVESAEQLAAALAQLIDDQTRRDKRGRAALKVAEGNRGALAKTLSLVEEQL